MSSQVIPPAPEYRFASDNNATVHPVVMEALNQANAADATAYGDDPWTAQACSAFSELFGQQVERDFQTFDNLPSHFNLLTTP